MSDKDDPVVLARRETCHQLRQPDFTALCAQRYLPITEGGKGWAQSGSTGYESVEFWQKAGYGYEM